MNLFLYKGFFVLAEYGCQNYFDCKDTLILCFSVSDMLQEFSYLITTPPIIRFLFHQNFLSIHDVDTFHRSRMGDSIERNVVFWKFVVGFHLYVIHS